MHLTWQPGDPVIQLNFPNPLNVSVQIGDVAYFSNPTSVGVTGNPLSGNQWTATTTPHLSNPQAGIFMIGEIVQIIPWGGTFSSIICNMPQDLFNQYFADIVQGGCTSVASGNITCTGDCCNYDPMVNWPVIGGYQPVVYTATNNPLIYFFDNPTVSGNDVMFHYGDFPTGSNFCKVNPNAKSVNGINDYNTDPTYDNVWVTNHHWTLTHPFVQGPLGQINFQNFVGQTANDVIQYIIALDNGAYAADYNIGMTFDQFNNARADTSIINATITAVEGTYSDTYTETCTQGSFIMFSKDNKANMSSILGYYASVEFRNSSQVKSELFNVGTDFFISSK